MRVRIFELRLLAAGLVALWALAGGLVLIAYRPGGPIDLVVGLASSLPIAVAVAALIWPPAARGEHAFAIVGWLGVGAVLVLLPSIGGVLNQILARGTQTLMPSAEVIYPWVLALLATSLFAGLGIARRLLGEHALRRPRLVLGVAIGVVTTAAIAGVFGGVAVANELALRDHPATASRFGPTSFAIDPPACSGSLAIGPTATLQEDLTAEADRGSLGDVTITGARSAGDIRWIAKVATTHALGTYGLVAVDTRSWIMSAGSSWVQGPRDVSGELLDRTAATVALTPENRAAAEDHGLEFVGGARARHCRIAIDGPTFLAAFPQSTWLIGTADVTHWRGELDYWVFEDGQVGEISGSVDGLAGTAAPDRLLATVNVTLTATDRGAAVAVEPPAP